MPKGTNQKLKLYYLGRIMLEKTDEEHSLTMPQIKAYLEEYGVTADRKSLYDDLRALEVLGIEVTGEKNGRDFYYYVSNKQFEIAELKLLTDAIQSSKFITEKKSRELIKKLMTLASRYEAMQLQRQVVVQGRIKTMNESIYYIVDEIHRAISENRKIRFKYMQWSLDKTMVPRRKELYETSPWALTWDDENYYLIAYDSEMQMVKHYRVDKMQNIEITDDPRDGRDCFGKIDMAAYTRKSFGMYGGEDTRVKLRFNNDLVGVLIDRFGRDIPITPDKQPGWSQTSVDVTVSDLFFGWIFALGKDVQIISPEDVAARFEKELHDRLRLYDPE
ncbi:MAG: WYL domain-containing protein [Lachnospiraceae bacterium]|nr:WYL domain-containing protein [Lachnospiraceae bacterium]